MKVIQMPSGAILKVGPAKFSEAKALYQAVLGEAKNLNVTSKTEIAVLVKDVLCSAYTSPVIDKALWDCFKYCIYGDKNLKIDQDTFEPVENREDYMLVCMEVAEENLRPFSKSLTSVLQRVSATVLKNLA